MTSERAQTTQDYLVGASVLLLTVLFVFSYTPGVFASYQSVIDSDERAQADRAAEYLLSNFSVEGSSNVLRYDASEGIHERLGSDDGFETFRESAGLDTRTARIAKPNVNVTIVNASQIEAKGDPTPIVTDAGERLQYGENVDRNQSVAAVTRVVTLAGDPKNATSDPTKKSEPQCDPSCWLLVRVW